MRALASVSLLLPLAACETFSGRDAGTAALTTAEAVAEKGLLDGLAWEPFRLADNTGANVESIEIVDDMLIVRDSSHGVHVLDLAHGNYRWMLHLDDAPTRPVNVGSSVVGFLARYHLTVVTRDTGSRLLERDLAFTPSSDGILTRHTFYAGSWGNSYMLRSVSLDDGWNGWSFAFSGPVTGAPALVGTGPEASVVVAAQDGTVAALPTRPATAAAPTEPLWSYQTLGENPAGATTDGTMVFVPSQDRALYALEAAVGSVRWKWFAEQPLLRLPVVGADAVYQPDSTGVAAIDKATGELRYRVDEANTFLTRIGVRDYFRLANGAVLAVDSRSGAELAYLSSPLFSFVAGSPTGSMFVFSDGSTVYALR